MQFEDHHEEQFMECELQGEDLNGKDRFVEVKNLPPGFIKDNDIQSGVTTLFAAGAQIDDALGVLHVPYSTTVATVSDLKCFCSL